MDRRRWLATLAPLLATGGLRAQEAEGPQPRPWPAARPTPALRLPAWQGPPFDLAGARGQVVLLNFWASWCEPCREEMPSLELLAERYQARRLVAYAVNHKESDAAIRRFLATWAFSLPILRDADGAAARDWSFRVFPSTALIGRDGRARFTVTGEVDWTGPVARRWIEAVL